MQEEIDYEIIFKSIRIQATSPEEAESKAETKINNGEIEIKSVTEI